MTSHDPQRAQHSQQQTNMNKTQKLWCDKPSETYKRLCRDQASKN